MGFAFRIRGIAFPFDARILVVSLVKIIVITLALILSFLLFGRFLF